MSLPVTYTFPKREFGMLIIKRLKRENNRKPTILWYYDPVIGKLLVL